MARISNSPRASKQAQSWGTGGRSPKTTSRTSPGFVKAALTLVLVAGSTLPVRATDDFAGYVVQLAATNPEREAVRAERALIEAGRKAFPTILAHLDDSAPLQPRLANRAVRGTPTVGGRCFDLLQVQIEGNWPKGFRQFYI